MKLNPLEMAYRIAEYVQCDKSGSCGMYASWVTRVFLRHGYKDFVIVFGWIRTKSGGFHDHIWLELNINGQVIQVDPTLVQFEDFESYCEKETHLYPEGFLRRKGFRLEDPRTKPWYKKHLKNSIDILNQS
jgi:hypothetical protein